MNDSNLLIGERINRLQGNLIDLFLDLHQDSPDKNNRMKTISVNIPKLFQDKIELLCIFGFYSNRSELIRTAVRNLLKAEFEDLDVFIELKKVLKNPKIRERLKRKLRI